MILLFAPSFATLLLIVVISLHSQFSRGTR